MDSSIGHQRHNFLLLEHYHCHGHDYDRSCNVKLKLMILQQHRISASASAHGILAFLFPTLLAFLQLQVSVKEAPPSSDLFETRPTVLSTSSFLAHRLLLGASLGFPCYARSFHNAAVFLGSLSVASLASLLLPHYLFSLPYVLVISVPALLLSMFIRLGQHHFSPRTFIPEHYHFSSESSRSRHNTSTLHKHI